MNKVKRGVRSLVRALDAATDDWEPAEYVIMPDVQHEALRHPGEWVAITRDRFLAAGATSAEVLSAARVLGVDAPMIYVVPLPDGDHFYVATSAGGVQA